MKKQKEIENIKIGVIDSGIDKRFSVFSLNKKSEGSDWNNINLQDTIIQKITLIKGGRAWHTQKYSKTLDKRGHGTKCASVAVARKTEIKLHNTFPVSIEGAAPSAGLYIYKVSLQEDSEYQDIICAFNAAIEDKVDVISVSFGPSSKKPDEPYHTDAIAMGSLDAMKHNILTVAACGNNGPNGSIRNVAPWILTVGASESKKQFKATVEIGSKKFEGSSLNPSDIKRKLCIFPPDLKISKNQGGGEKSQDTHKRERNEDPLKGYIVLCSDLKEMKLAKMNGAEGILYQDCTRTPYAKDDKNFPSVWLAKDDFEEIRQLICKNSNLGIQIMAKICRSRMVDNPKPFVVAEFSSRGPNPITKEILKPDICAPGVEICVPLVNPIKNDEYTIASGTSYACPLVAGKAAILKREFQKIGLNPTPDMLKSALMTTADNPPENECGIFAKGAGFPNFDKAMNPGLVYICGAKDYDNCFLKKERNKIKPWKLNYPSITFEVPKDGSKYSWEIPRRLKYVGTTSEIYKARITDQSHTVGIKIKIEPSTLCFNGLNRENNFKVILTINKEDWTKTKKLYTASLEWSPQTNKHQCVRSPIVILKEAE